MNSKPSFLANIPPVTLNLLIINVIFFLATDVLGAKFNIDLTNFLALHFVKSSFFNPLQFVSYMFMHANIIHIFCNMFGVYTFGMVLERFWGGKKFLLFYFVAGIGAALVQQLIWYIDFNSLMQHIDYQKFDEIKNEGYSILQENKYYTNEYFQRLNILLNIPTVGASGALFGILFAFGFMFPKEKLFIILIPVPLPARIFVILYAVIELFFGVANFSWDNIAHFAHLGGALFGLIMIFWWRWRGKLYNRY